MGQRNKQQNRYQKQLEENPRNTNGQSNQEEKRDEKQDITLKAYIHCDGCSSQVNRCLRGFTGVEDVVVDRANNKVTVKAKGVDPIKVLERLQNKYSRNVELIYPKPERKEKKETEIKRKEEVRIVVLKMFMHCEGCSGDIKKAIEKMEGVFSVEPNKETSNVTVKGVMDPKKLVEKVREKMGKHVEIVKQEQANKAESQAHKDNDNDKPHEEATVLFAYPPQYSAKYLYPNQNFSDENVYVCALM